MRDTIAIVGGGSVATSFACQFVAALEMATLRTRAPDVAIFEPAQRIGRGSAYADDLESNLLNVPVGGMSVSADDKLHFSRWLQREGISTFRGVTIHDRAFVSRSLFGQYLESVHSEVVDRARAMGVTIHHIRDEVTAIEQAGGAGFTVRTGSTALPAGHVVLEIGNLDSPAFSHLRCHGHFLSSPYPVRRLVEQVRRDATVCILGTSLSAIDAILALATSHHRGKILAVSRSGRLPSVRGVLNRPLQLRDEFKRKLAAMKQSGEQLTVDSLIALLGHELAISVKEWCGESAAKLAARPSGTASECLEEEIRLAASVPRQWQSFSAALNEVIDLLWHLLSAPERDRFNREVRAPLMLLKGSFPLENARALLELLDAGRLEVLGGFHGVDFDRTRAAFRVDTREGGAQHATGKRCLYADWVVNATSFSADVASCAVPLLRSLVESGAATIDRFGGLSLDYDTGCVVDARGSINRRMSALGTMASGTYFWTNAMEVNARLAKGQATRLAKAWT